MAALIQAVDRRTRLGVLLLDVLTTEQVSFENEVTMFPVETGVEISDHITLREKRITLTGKVSTADVTGGWGIASNFGFSAGDGPKESKLVDVIEALERMYEARAMVEVSTGQMVYKDMAFTRLSAERSSDGGLGNWVTVNAELRRIRKVSLKTADVPPPETVQQTDGAQGRAGETNKPAGKGSSTSGQNNAAQAKPDNRTVTKRIADNVSPMGTDGVRQVNPAFRAMFGL